MIRYRRGTYATAFYWWGGINQLVVGPCLVYGCLVSFIYACQVTFETTVHMNAQCLHSLASFVVFLLVFRLNQCMSRYNDGKQGVFDLFLTLEDIMSTTCFSIKGARGVGTETWVAGGDASSSLAERAEAYDELALCMKVNIIRLTLAFGIAFMIHCRLVEAVSDTAGEIDEAVMEQMLFLHGRLQGLLYKQELELIDRAIFVTCEQVGGRRKLQTEICRHHMPGEMLGEPIIGDLGSAEGGKTVAALPKVCLMLLRNCMTSGINQPWGYPERLINVYFALSSRIIELLGQLNNVMAMPVPLIYIQHCRTLLYIFAICFPISIDITEGALNNVVLPVMIFWAMLGFELIAESFENPLGNDDNDINVWEFLHGLEVHAKYCFEVTEARSVSLDEALARPLQDFGLHAGQRARTPFHREKGHARPFEAYFSWLPMPMPVLTHMLTDHGDVDRMHRVRLDAHIHGLSRLLKAPESRRGAGGHYEAVATDDTEAGQWDDSAKAVYAEAVEADPNACKHYLVFRGLFKKKSNEERREASKNTIGAASRLLGSKVVRCATAIVLDVPDSPTNDFELKRKARLREFSNDASPPRSPERAFTFATNARPVAQSAESSLPPMRAQRQASPAQRAEVLVRKHTAWPPAPPKPAPTPVTAEAPVMDVAEAGGFSPSAPSASVGSRPRALDSSASPSAAANSMLSDSHTGGGLPAASAAVPLLSDALAAASRRVETGERRSASRTSEQALRSGAQPLQLEVVAGVGAAAEVPEVEREPASAEREPASVEREPPSPMLPAEVLVSERFEANGDPFLVDGHRRVSLPGSSLGSNFAS